MQTERVRLRRLATAARASHELAKTDREARDTAIEEAEQLGLSVREIASEVDLSPARVQKIIIDRTAARQERLSRSLGDPHGPATTS